MKNSDLRKALRLYAVTDRAWVGKQTLYQQVESALQGGITMLQLREKNIAHDDFLTEANEMKQLCQHYNVPLIINDDIEIAIQANADGLHIGQDDCPVRQARATLGSDKILGVSAQTVEQAVAAERDGADYLGVGAIFTTATKQDAASVSIDTLTQICKSVKIPVVAIGGIDVDNTPLLLPTGICGIAVVSAIFAADNITAACEKLNQILRF